MTIDDALIERVTQRFCEKVGVPLNNIHRVQWELHVDEVRRTLLIVEALYEITHGPQSE